MRVWDRRGSLRCGALLLSCALLLPATSSRVRAASLPETCDAGSLEAALAAAEAGDIVSLGECVMPASALVVPAGVALVGDGPATTVLHVPRGEVGLFLEGGEATPTVLGNLAIVSEGRAAVVVEGGGFVDVAQVLVDARTGIGIGAEGVSSLALSGVTLLGPVTAESAPLLPPLADPNAAATHGLVTAGVGELLLADVQTDGFAAFGALLAHTRTSWTGGGAAGNAGVGIGVWNGSASLNGLTVEHTFAGALPEGDFPAGVAVLSGADVTSAGLRVSDTHGYGLFHDSAGLVQHERLHAARNAMSGVWYQSGEYLGVDGGQALHNGHAGILAFDSGFASISGATIVGTGIIAGTGDGIQLVGTAADVFDTRLNGNERIGLLAELAPDQTLADLRFGGVHANATGRDDRLGLLVQQNGVLLDLVTDGVRRSAPTAGRDAAFVEDATTLLESVMSGDQPDFLPQAEAVGTFGLAVLLDVLI